MKGRKATLATGLLALVLAACSDGNNSQSALADSASDTEVSPTPHKRHRVTAIYSISMPSRRLSQAS